jgi:pentatricopeptide repeat protein
MSKSTAVQAVQASNLVCDGMFDDMVAVFDEMAERFGNLFEAFERMAEMFGCLDAFQRGELCPDCFIEKSGEIADELFCTDPSIYPQ